MSFLDYEMHNLESLILNQVKFIGLNFDASIFSLKNRMNLLKYLQDNLQKRLQ